MISRSIGRYIVNCAVAYCVLVFTFSFVVKFTHTPQILFIFGIVSDSLADVGLSKWAELFRSYGHYLMANFELATVALLLFPATRIMGALLGVFIVGSALFVHLATPLGLSVPIDQIGQRDGGLVFFVACGTLVACLTLLVLQIKQRRRKDKFAGEQLPPGQVPKAKVAEKSTIADYVQLKGEVPFSTEVTAEVDESFSQLLFGVTRPIQDVIEGEHKKVLNQADGLIETLPSQRKYFPRRPMIIPKLIRAVNNEDSTKKELVDVIAQDPVLAGELLKIANSPYYRISEEPVESIGRSIVVLGMNGLKALASTLVMQPVVQVETSHFPQFSSQIWKQAAKAALAAQAYARKTRSCDSFTAHLLGLISSIGHIVIFQMLMDVYKEISTERPKIEVLSALRDRHADTVSASVAEQWGLSEDFIETLKAHRHQASINDMSALGRALYYGRLCATLHLLFQADRYSEDRVRFVATQQGLHPEVFDAIWLVLNSDESSLAEVWEQTTARTRASA